MLLVDCLTDNANRTIGEVRPAFTKGKGKMGTPGTVAHMFEHAAVFVLKGMKRPCLSASLWPTLTCWKLRAKRQGYRDSAQHPSSPRRVML